MNNVPACHAAAIFNYNNTQVRVIEKDGEPWFVARDVCAVLGIGSGNVARDLEADEQGIIQLMTPKGYQGVKFVNESGLYSLIMTSRKPSAKQLRRWVTSEVLPSIRKTGSYSVPQVFSLDLLELMIKNAREQEARVNLLESPCFEH